MFALTLATVLHASLLGAGTDTYAEAHRVTRETGKPMLVMVGTQWCGPCQTMKKHTLPQLRKNGALAKVAFAAVDANREAALSRKLTGGGPVPQLVMFRQTGTGWKRRKLVGGQSVQSIEQFIREGLALDAGEKGKIQPVSTR